MSLVSNKLAKLNFGLIKPGDECFYYEVTRSSHDLHFVFKTDLIITKNELAKYPMPFVKICVNTDISAKISSHFFVLPELDYSTEIDKANYTIDCFTTYELSRKEEEYLLALWEKNFK